MQIMDGPVKDRSEVSALDCWNTGAMYRDYSEWEKDLSKWSGSQTAPFYPTLDSSLYDLTKTQDVKKLLDAYMEIDRHLTLIYTYAHLRHDEDVAEETSKKAYMSAIRAFHGLQEEASWIEPAFLQLSQEVLDQILNAKELEGYHVYLKKIIRLKPHTLSAEKEQLVAAAGRALETSVKAFRALNDADLRFPDCKDEKGELHELTHGSYSLYIKDKDRTLRKEAFTNLHETFGLFENTFCELLEGQVQKLLFRSRIRNYNSCLESALFPHEIDLSVYTSLVNSAKQGLPVLHDYLSVRKKQLGYSELRLYDMYVPIVHEVEIKKSYEEAVEVILESLSVLGGEYQAILKKGLLEDRWVDRYENKRKRSGAYSSGCYDSMPYILMNYHGTLQDVMTLAHEAGHSMHSFYSRKHQAYQDADYSIFVAEVASTFHEELLFQSLLKKASSKEEKAYLISQKMDAIRGTFFRQTMFAEFELYLYECVEKGVPLTPALLKNKYLELNKEYFGPGVEIDSSIQWEWSRIPHFYSSFYVYQYATGISAACTLATQVLSGDKAAADRYIEFISAGSSLDPLAVLKRAGVDMKTSDPIDSLLNYFQELGSQLKDLLSKE
jgi:oligoendopeptidase F